jgi:hypothetical protein
MTRWKKLVALALAAIVTVAVAAHLANFLEQDNCIDAGGTYISSTGACEIEGADYVALFSRIPGYALWAAFLGLCYFVGWAVYRVVAFILGALRSRQERAAADVRNARG